MSAAIGLLILDEFQDLNTNIRATLDHMPQFHSIDEVELDETDIEHAVVLAILNDIQLAAGIARIFKLKERWPKLRILVAFDALTAGDFEALLVAGASAFVGRSQSPREICTALLALASGANCLAQSERENDFGLTPREAEVLRFLISGFSNKDVARHLDLSVRTVETHRVNLRRKTRTGRLSDLVSLARQLGLPPVTNDEMGRHGNKRFVPRSSDFSGQ